MARGINKVILLGNLGNAPEVRKTTNGSTVTNVGLATSDVWKDKQTGENQERTEWHRVIFFNRLAEIVEQYCQKGSKIYVEGRIQTRKWQDKEGQERYTTEIIASEMQLLDSRNGGEPKGASDCSSYQTNNKAAGREDYQPSPSNYTDEAPVFDDDIPF